MSSRILNPIVLVDGARQLSVIANSGTELLSLAAGTYYWSLDDSASDLGKAIEDLLVTHAEITTCTVEIIGVDLTDATRAEGRIRISCDLDFTLEMSASQFEIDKRIFGFAVDEASDQTSSSTRLYSDYVHIGGWYPQITADWHPATRGSWAEVSGGAAASTVEAVDWGQFERIDLEWLVVLSALMRTAGAADSGRAGQVNLTTGDPHAALEAWVRLMVRAAQGAETVVDETWRFFADATDTDTYSGDYRFPADSSLWSDPLALSSVLSRAGEEWTARLEGVRGPL